MQDQTCTPRWDSKRFKKKENKQPILLIGLQPDLQRNCVQLNKRKVDHVFNRSIRRLLKYDLMFCSCLYALDGITNSQVFHALIQHFIYIYLSL